MLWPAARAMRRFFGPTIFIACTSLCCKWVRWCWISMAERCRQSSCARRARLTTTLRCKRYQVWLGFRRIVTLGRNRRFCVELLKDGVRDIGFAIGIKNHGSLVDAFGACVQNQRVAGCLGFGVHDVANFANNFFSHLVFLFFERRAG